jgi:hypothetical protein
VGATFCKVPAHSPDPGNPGHYMNVFKTPTTLNDGQQQPFCKVPAHYPDPGNPGHYMNVFKTPTTLNDGQQQPVDNFDDKHMLEYIRHLEELQIVSMIRENAGLYYFDCEF